MGFLSLLKQFEDNVNNLFDSYNNSDMSLLFDELRQEFEQHIISNIDSCINFENIIKRHSKISDRIFSKFSANLENEKNIFLEKYFNINFKKDEIIENLHKEIAEDLQDIENKLSKVHEDSTDLSKSIQLFINSFLFRYKKNIIELEKQLENSDDYYYSAVSRYSDEMDSYTTLTHSNRSKILFNAEQMHEQNVSSFIKKIESIKEKIKEIDETSETKEKISRKSILLESGFFNSNIASEKFSFEKKTKDIRSNNMQVIKEIELDIEKINSVSDERRQKILIDYTEQLKNIDDKFENLYKEHLEFKEQVLRIYEENITKLEKDIITHKYLNSSSEDNDENNLTTKKLFLHLKNRKSELNMLYKKLNSTKEQHVKNLEGIERLHNNIINNRQYEKFKAEITKNTDLEIEEITRNLQLRIAREEIDFNKKLLENNLSLLSHNHDFSFNNLSIEKEKLVLKHSMDIKTLQISSHYNKQKFNSEIEKLRLESDYVNNVHDLVIESGKKHSTTLIDKERHLTMLKKEKYRILKNYNNNIFLKSLRQELNIHYLFEKSLEAKVDNYDFKKRETLSFLNHKKDFLKKLNIFMIEKESSTAQSLIKIESNKYHFHLKELQKKKAHEQYRIDKILIGNTFNLFIQLSSIFNNLILTFSNNIKNYDMHFEESDFHEKLLNYFEGFNFSLISLLENNLHILTKSYNGIEPSTLLYSIHSKEIKKHELKRKNMELQIANTEQTLKNSNNSLTKILNHTMELERDKIKLRKKILSSRIKEFRNDYKKQIQIIKNQLRANQKTSNNIYISLNKENRDLRILKRKMKYHINNRPHIKSAKVVSHKINHDIFVDVFKKITKYTQDVRKQHSIFFSKIRETNKFIENYSITPIYNLHRQKFPLIITYANKKYTSAYQNMILTASANIPKDLRKIRNKSSILNKNYDNKIKKQLIKFNEIRKIYNLELISSETKINKSLNSIKLNYENIVKMLDNFHKDNQVKFFNNNLAIDENIEDIENKYTKKLEDINNMNKNISNNNYTTYIINKRKIKNQEKRNNKMYLSDLRRTPKLLRAEEKDTLQEFRVKKIEISKMRINNERSRKQSYNVHRKNISSLNKQYLITINKIKKLKNYQIKQLEK